MSLHGGGRTTFDLAFVYDFSRDAYIASKRQRITDTTESTDPDVGSLTVLGGVGIAKKLNVGGATSVIDTTESSSISTGSAVISGGIGIAKKTYLGSSLNFPTTAPSNVSGQTLPYAVNYINILDFGAKNDISFDSTSAIQAAINYAQSNISAVTGLSPYSTTVYFPSGTYKITSGLTITNNTFISTRQQRVNLLGEGQNSIISAASGTYDVLTVQGDTVVATNAFQSFKNLYINKSDGLGRNLVLKRLAYCYFENLVLYNANACCYTEAVLTSTFTKCQFMGSLTNGFEANSSSNALCFVGCTFGGNQQLGAKFTNCENNNFYGGTVEGNVTGGMSFIDSVGSNGCNISGMYLEGNGGAADVLISQSAQLMQYGISNCTFNRVGTSQFTTNNIICSCSSTFDIHVNIVGCGFNGFGGYVPNSSRKYITTNDTSTGRSRVSWHNPAFLSSTELPSIHNNYTVSFGGDTNTMVVNDHAKITGTDNVGVGKSSLLVNTTGTNNTCVGAESGIAITSGSNNTAIGYQSFKTSTTATQNTAVGSGALFSQAANNSTAVGYNCLRACNAASNTGMGLNTLQVLTSGTQCAGFGRDALGGVTTGSSNTGCGMRAGLAITTGNGNTCLGLDSGNDALISLTTQDNQLVLGNNSTTTSTFGGSTLSMPNLSTVTTGQTTLNLFNTIPTTVNAFGAATALTLGKVSANAASQTATNATTYTTLPGAVKLPALQSSNWEANSSAMMGTGYKTFTVTPTIGGGGVITGGAVAAAMTFMAYKVNGMILIHYQGTASFTVTTEVTSLTYALTAELDPLIDNSAYIGMYATVGGLASSSLFLSSGSLQFSKSPESLVFMAAGSSQIYPSSVAYMCSTTNWGK